MKPRNTRDRILAACRRLFNARGPSAVTTAAIAQEVNINEGNLYYYFQKKADIVKALFEQFADAQLALTEHEDELRGWFRLMWDWRFFYRDSVAVFGMAPSLRRRLRKLSDDVQERNRRNLRHMVENGRMEATEAEIEHLLINSWIVSTYWIDYLNARHGITRITKRHIDWGYYQMEALFHPYLTTAESIPPAL